MLFVVAAGFNSLVHLPDRVTGTVLDLDTYLLAMAMAVLGLHTHLSAIRKAGGKAIVLGGVVFIFLIVRGGLISQGLRAIGAGLDPGHLAYEQRVPIK